jgi:hypothetical protein
MQRFDAIGFKTLLWVCATGLTGPALAQEDAAATLRAKHAALSESLRMNQFQRPLVLDSSETANQLTGNIYAVMAYPFAEVNAGLNNPAHWCEVLILHINTKYCHARTGVAGTVLNVNIGKKTPELLADTARLEFHYSTVLTNPEYFQIQLSAKEGPLSTRDYRIQMEGVALPNAMTFLHLTYSYGFNFMGRLGMQTYLATVGRGKVGFTLNGRQADGQPDYIGGVRGLVERNTMRYYLAIDAFMASVHVAPEAQLEHRLRHWFTAAEGYPRQLHEVDQQAYLDMKQAEYLRQQSAD